MGNGVNKRPDLAISASITVTEILNPDLDKGRTGCYNQIESGADHASDSCARHIDERHAECQRVAVSIVLRERQSGDLHVKMHSVFGHYRNSAELHEWTGCRSKRS